MPLNLKYQTKAQLADRVRARFRAASRERMAQIARLILGLIADGEFTDAQLRSAFGLNASQWTTLKGKMQALDDARRTVENATGE